MGHGGPGCDHAELLAVIMKEGGGDVRVTEVRTICVTAKTGYKGNDTGFIMCWEPLPPRHYDGVTFDQDQREA